MTLGERIRQARGERSQAELAELIGVDSITVSRWERDVVTPGARATIRLCAALGMTLDDFNDEQVA